MDVSAMKCEMCFPLECHQSAKVHTTVVKRVGERFCLAQTPHASKNERHKPYFFRHVITVVLSSSKILTDGNLHWPLATPMTTKPLMKQTSFVV